MDVRTWRKKTKGKVDKTKGKVDKIFGNDKGCFEVRLAKLSDGSKVLTGLGGRQPERSGGLFHLRRPAADSERDDQRRRAASSR